MKDNVSYGSTDCVSVDSVSRRVSTGGYLELHKQERPFTDGD